MTGSRITRCGGLAVLAFVIAATPAAPALADVKAGVDAWSRGDFATATAAWEGPASRGDADAQFNLAQAYKLGRGVKQDLAKAEELFGLAAARGHLQASDNFGLLLFQRGERSRALPYITAASDRGDPRAQYLLGLASFNGDNVPKNWVRAYALVSLAQQAGLPQAASALAQMDQYIPLDQRQQSVAVAQELAAQANATRTRQLASADLGGSVTGAPATPPVTVVPRAPLPRAPLPPAPRQVLAPPRPPVYVANAPPPREAPEVAPPARSGGWRVQLGAFGVAANADAMWQKLRSRPELAGHAKLLVPAGRVRKLQAAGFSEAGARNACSRLAAAGHSCLAVPGS